MMRNKRGNNLFVKVVTGLLAIILVMGVVYLVKPDEKYVLAAENNGDVVKLEDTEIDYKVKEYSDISDYRIKDATGNFKVPTLTTAELVEAQDTTPGEWLFAGWYTNEACTTSLSSSVVYTEGAAVNNGPYYAKFVPADVLSVKCQITAGTESGSTETVLRCISTVDSLKYKGIGLRLVRPDGSVGKMDNNKVNTRIKARTDINVEAYSYSPKVVDTESEYFFSATEVINSEDFGKEYIVKPYWITKDGTTVWGVSRCVSVNEAINKDVIYVPVKMKEAPTEGATLTANDGTNNYTLTYSDKYDAETGYAHFKMTTYSEGAGTKTEDLGSLTKYEVTGDGVDTSYVYRNLNTKIKDKTTGVPSAENGTDQSWYTIANELGEDEFVIATAAELYGLAEIVVDNKNSLTDKTIYLVADIAVNQGCAEATKWNSSVDEGGNSIEGTARSWRVIGNTTYRFDGRFDGQMHSISGIYFSTSSGYIGLFGGTDTNAEIKNLHLKNSFVAGKGQVGSIVGNAKGSTFDTIYSEAVVRSSANYAGGLLGATSDGGGVTMSNCWFNGSVTCSSAASYYGGLIGRVQYDSTITNCQNSGSVTNTLASSSAGTGGFVGQLNSGVTVSISHCLNTGTITYKSGAKYFGLLVGYEAGTANVVDSYSTTQSGLSLVYGKDDSTYTNSAQVGAETDIAAEKALTTSAMTSLFSTTTEEGTTESYWSIVPGHGPSLASFAETVYGSAQPVDTSWQDAEGTAADPYLIADMADFYGFAMLSKSNPFTEKTIKLSKDIATKNEGDAEDWATTAPDYEWIGIGTIDLPFSGTFNGKNHEISGIYLKESSSYQGMFVATGANAEIKNFYLKNSYFETTTTDSKGGQLGSIVGNAQGTFKTIYSDAIVAGYCNRVGGLIGATSTSNGVTMSDCWFAGSATINSAASYLGGLIGNVAADSSITNCLNTGEVYHKYSVSTNGAGGFAGWVGSSITLDILYSVNTSNVKYTGGKYYGLFVGKADGTVNATYCHSINYSGKNQVGNDSSGTNPYDTCTRQTATNIAGSKSLTTDKVKELFTAEVAKDYWAITPDSLPVLTSLAEKAGITAQAVDTSWYDASKTEVTLMDSGDLYGLAVLSKLTDVDGFTGKTIKLGADIEINSGNAADWATTAPDYGWIGIGSDSNYFKGTFDGGLYTVRGIYFNDSQSVGLFVATDEGSTIQKLKLENSYFEASGIRCGSIAATGKGNFYMIYSDSIVIGSENYIGGLVGITAGEVVMENCWFDGTVTNTGTAAQYTGGLVGRVNSGNITLKNCLNSAPVSSSYNTINDNNQIVIAVGGLVGSIASEAQLEANACLNTGKIEHYTITTDDEVTEVRGYGPIVGYSNNKAAAIMYSTYATTESCTETDKSNITANFATVSESDIKGNNAKTAMPLLGWDVDWECVDGEFPAIIFSTTGFGEVVDNTATASDKILLSNLYDGRTLYQGEAHDHADNGGSSDGTVSLADWKTQMTDTTSESYVDLDFAASLDHRQTWHINHTDWDRDMFIYGTEAATTLTDNNATFHYNMYFTEREQLQNVLKNFQNNKLVYDETKDNANATTTDPSFQYTSLTEQEFTELIQDVKVAGGFFSLPHPTTYFTSEDAMDYYFADEIGFEVIYLSLTSDGTKQNYKMWTELLAKGKHLWACAGNDGHANLSTDALTSIYAKKLDSEKYLSEAYVRNMSKGAFTAGSVGIQMCINETQMGGSCDFNGQRLVVGIPQGAFHESILAEGSKYRVEILNEDGVVYSQEISNDNDTYLAFNADESSMFYRVEVYNATIGLRIAIGNPIWNN